MTEYLDRRFSTLFTGFPGKVALRGRRSFRFTKINGKPLKEALWHSCGNRRDFVSKLVDVNIVRINHYQFRFGKKSLAKRVERGYAKDFKDQKMYADIDINDLPSVHNETEDFTMTKIRDVFPQLLENCPSLILECVSGVGRADHKFPVCVATMSRHTPQLHSIFGVPLSEGSHGGAQSSGAPLPTPGDFKSLRCAHSISLSPHPFLLA